MSASVVCIILHSILKLVNGSPLRGSLFFFFLACDSSSFHAGVWMERENWFH